VQWYQNEREQQQVAALFNDKLSVRDKRRRVHYIGNAAVEPTFDPTPRKKTIAALFNFFNYKSAHRLSPCELMKFAKHMDDFRKNFLQTDFSIVGSCINLKQVC
jgi:hypothetical protein